MSKSKPEWPELENFDAKKSAVAPLFVRSVCEVENNLHDRHDLRWFKGELICWECLQESDELASELWEMLDGIDEPDIEVKSKKSKMFKSVVCPHCGYADDEIFGTVEIDASRSIPHKAETCCRMCQEKFTIELHVFYVTEKKEG